MIVDGGSAVFIDRDGVLIEDVHLLMAPEQVRMIQGAGEALGLLSANGFRTIVVSNQTVVARGMSTEQEVERVHAHINALLESAGEGGVDAFYYCPHHPHADVERYCVECDCRKPRPGLLLKVAREFGLDLERSYMVGDRITDIIAGQRAGCTTVMVRSGRHDAPPIDSPDEIDLSCRPHRTCADLLEAAKWIIERTP